MRLTAKGEYGMRAVLNLAGRTSGDPVSVGRIAEEEGVSAEFLEQIFFRLKKAGLVRSVRGPKGGFVLDREASEVSLKMVLDALEEPIYPVPCTNHENDPCERQNGCPMSPVWHEFYAVMRDHLEGVKLEDVLRRKGAAQSVAS